MSFNDISPGFPTHNGYKSFSRVSDPKSSYNTGLANIQAVNTRGTETTRVFGSVTGFSGSIVAVRATFRGSGTAATVSLITDHEDATVYKVCDVSRLGAGENLPAGYVTGSAILAKGRFAATGSVALFSSAADGNALVEVIFVPD